MTTEDVFNHHLSAFGAGNTDEIIKDFTEDSLLILPDTTCRGITAIRGAFEQFFSGLFKPGTYEFTLDRGEVDGNVAYAVWRASTSAGEVRMGTDTFVIRDGKIAVQTAALYLETK